MLGPRSCMLSSSLGRARAMFLFLRMVLVQLFQMVLVLWLAKFHDEVSSATRLDLLEIFCPVKQKGFL